MHSAKPSALDALEQSMKPTKRSTAHS